MSYYIDIKTSHEPIWWVHICMFLIELTLEFVCDFLMLLFIASVGEIIRSNIY